MLRGRVEGVTDTLIRGWAADDERPDEVVEISIFVNDVKIAQIPCQDMRRDLKGNGSFGEGRHGFQYRLDPALPNDVEARIVVRFTQTGSTLSAGEVLLSDHQATALPAVNPARSDEPLFVPAPRYPAVLFKTFSLFQEESGLYQLLTRLKFDLQTPEDIWLSVFGETNKAIAEREFERNYSPRDHLYELLMSERFQADLIPLILRAFPEKARLFFVHVPKCAGTDLSAILKRRYVTLERTLSEPAWTSKVTMFKRLSRIALYLQLCDSLFMTGHVKLKFYSELRLIRPSDRVFTIVRDPTEMAISQINYVITRITTDIKAGVLLGPDTRQWLVTLGVALPGKDIDEGFVRELATKALHNLVLRNSTCHWLGDGDAKSAMDLIIANNVEITDTTRYNGWLDKAWGIKSATRLNTSKLFVTLETLDRRNRDYLDELVAEDTKLYGVLQSALSSTGKVSVSGSELKPALAKNSNPPS